MGVKRAIGMARDAAREEKRTVYTYGPLIHNPQELERLRSEGILPIGEQEPTPQGASIIIRAHGITPHALSRLTKESDKVFDATCPKVSSIQERIRDHVENGYSVVIAGEPDHPEVVGLVGYAQGKAHVIQNPEEVDTLPSMDLVLLVAQTTQDELKYQRIQEKFLHRFPNGKSLSTICRSTHMRQSEIREMVGEVDAMVVIGGKNSGNTRRLYDISLEAGLPTYHIESSQELPLEKLKGLETVGVSAGASTPEWIIKEVVETLEKL